MVSSLLSCWPVRVRLASRPGLLLLLGEGNDGDDEDGEAENKNLQTDADDGQDALLSADASSEHEEEKGFVPSEAEIDLQQPQIEGQKSVTGVLPPINAEIIHFGDVLLRDGAEIVVLDPAIGMGSVLDKCVEYFDPATDQMGLAPVAAYGEAGPAPYGGDLPLLSAIDTLSDPEDGADEDEFDQPAARDDLCARPKGKSDAEGHDPDFFKDESADKPEFGEDVDLDEDAAADYCDVAESANYDGVADLMQLADEYTSVDEGACEEHAAEDAFAAHAAEFFEDDEFADDAVSAGPHEDRTKSADPDEDAESDADLSADDARDEYGVADEGISDAAADAYASLADAEAHVADADGSDASDNDDEDEDASADGISDEGTTAGADSADNDYDGDSADDASDGADADDTEFDDDAELAGNADPASSSDDGSVDEISNVNDMADEAVDAIEYVDVQAYEEDSSVDCVPADEDFYAGADAYRDVVGDPQKIVEAANTLLHAAIDDLIAAKDGDDLQPISANIVDGGPTAGDFPVESLFTPLWGSKDGQAREKFLYDAVKTMKPKARVKMKAELQIFYLTKCLLDPGI